MPPTNPCEGVSFSIQLPTLQCTDAIHADLGNVTDFARGLGSLPAQLGRMAQCMAEQEAAKIRQAIDALLKLYHDVFGEFPWSASTPLFKDIKWPEFELELKMRALWREYKVYLQTKLLELIAKLIPLNWLHIPIPYLDGCYVSDLLTAQGRAKIKAKVTEKVDSIARALGMPWDLTFNGTFTISSPSMRVQAILERIYTEIHNLLTNLLFSAFNKLISIFKKIWDTLHLPSLPSFSPLNFENMFENFWNQIKNSAMSAVGKMKHMVDSFLNFNIRDWLNKTFGALLSWIPWPFKLSVRELLNLSNVDWNFQAPEITFQRVMQAVKDLFANLMTMIYELWMKVVTAFFRLIGLGAILQYIPFTFCTFLNLVAAPILSLGSSVTGLLPSSVQVKPFVPPTLSSS